MLNREQIFIFIFLTSFFKSMFGSTFLLTSYHVRSCPLGVSFNPIFLKDGRKFTVRTFSKNQRMFFKYFFILFFSFSLDTSSIIWNIIAHITDLREYIYIYKNNIFGCICPHKLFYVCPVPLCWVGGRRWNLSYFGLCCLFWNLSYFGAKSITGTGPGSRDP